MDIVAMSSGTLSAERPARLLSDYIFGLTNASRPRVCFIPTATGDSDAYLVAFYENYPASRYETSHLALFTRTVKDLRSYVLNQDVIIVAGGNTANMLAIWRTHGLDSILYEAWQRGVILCGSSAGALCWFESGSTDSFGRDLSAMGNCLGFLAGSFCPHYDSEELRRPTYHRFVAQGLLPAGWALDDGAALHYKGTELQRIVGGKPGAHAYRVEKTGDEVRETPIEPEPLY